MSESLPDLYAEKCSIVRELFINTADDNYILARISFHANLDVDFFWLALHCVEKYLKAALLLNGREAKSYLHDIKALFSSVHALAPELFPEKVTRPDRMPTSFWRDETFKGFVERLYGEGQPDNRYQLWGYVRHPEDLWKLDEVVFYMRRVCQPLEAHFLLKPNDPRFPDETKRQRMNKDESSWRLGGRLEDTIEGRRGPELRRALLDWNRPFAPKDNYEHPTTTYRASSSHPVLHRRLLEPLDGGPSNFVTADKLWEWTRSNIKLSPDLIKIIEEERKARKSRHDRDRR
jgi:HEPN domain-containing protein